MLYKSTFSIAMCLALATGAFAASSLNSHSGDINADGVLDVADVTCYKEAALAEMAGSETPACQKYSGEEADLQCDGTINVTDVQRVILQIRYTYALEVLNNETLAQSMADLLLLGDADLDFVHDDCEEEEPVYSWLMLGKNEEHLSRSYAVGPIDPQLEWQFESDFVISSSVLVDEAGNLYFGARDGGIYALDGSGNMLWNVGLKGNASATPAIWGEVLYAISVKDGYDYLYAIDLNDGSLLWDEPFKLNASKKTSLTVPPSPVVAQDGTIFVSSYFATFYAINPDGTVKWQYDYPQAFSRSVPGIKYFDDGSYNVYFAFSLVIGSELTEDGEKVSGKLFAFNSEGEKIWNVDSYSPIGGEFMTSVTVGDEAIYTMAIDDSVRSYNSLTGELLWSYESEYDVYSVWPLALYEDFIYAGGKSEILKLSAETGDLVWVYTVPDDMKVSNKIFVDGEGNVYAADGWPDTDIDVISVDSNGNLRWIWQKELGKWVNAQQQMSMDGEGRVYLPLAWEEGGLVYVLDEQE